MKFCNFLLRVDGIREASLEDMKDVVAKGNHIFRPQKQKYLYSVDMDIIEERFFWMASDYDDAVRFRDYVINKKQVRRCRIRVQKNRLNQDNNFLRVMMHRNIFFI